MISTRHEADERRMHECRDGHMSHEPTRWAKDAQGIELCRVCDSCESQKLARYRPEIIEGYGQNDVNESINGDD